MTITAASVAGRTLISSMLFDVLVDRTITDFGVDPAIAPRVIDQALAFLATAGRTTDSDGALTPSTAVDPGWHAFLMYSRPYRAFCEQVAGRFIDHVPNDDPTVSRTLGNTPARGAASTMQAIARAGTSSTLNFGLPKAPNADSATRTATAAPVVLTAMRTPTRVTPTSE